MGSSQLNTKRIYSKLFQGYLPAQISPNEDTDKFYTTLLDSDVDRAFLQSALEHLTKDECLGPLKPVFNSILVSCISCARNPQYYESTKSMHALETLCIFTRLILAKNLSGWEIIDVFAGSAKESDMVFMALTSLVDTYLKDEEIPASSRHLALQLALVFMSSVSQLSPGAYFLKKSDLFNSLIQVCVFMKSPSTEKFTFEAAILLAILANYHRSDSSNLNPYLRQIKRTDDQDIMRKICWATNFALEAAINAYQEIHNEEASSTLISTLGSMLDSIRPDRALAAKPVDPPKEFFKNQPIEACVSLLPIYEFLRANLKFPSILLERPSTTSSPRSLAYANLALEWLLLVAENEQILSTLIRAKFLRYSPLSAGEHLLGQERLPLLPNPSSDRLPICALLDCCVLWLRHNLHKRLEVYCYTNCIWICQKIHMYEWKELWSAILGLLGFLATKLDSLYTTGGVENLVHEAESSVFLPSPQALHEFIYELVHDYQTLEKQVSLLQDLAMPTSPKQKSWDEDPSRILATILDTTRFYETKVAAAGARSATQAMGIVAREIDQDGLYGVKESQRIAPP
ncbi:hypothetical protein BT96DRAFT_957569 [Gymnopus androsaceus JB14]|uniref:Armadillo-like helical domain-containing protein n=1 Tax=Gymnopus androsaceus JB14 TaxID=1447944 RepID=A0A6A4HN59_9AGAR|nr:hypothetical protein BT96DRAFT_957569 [Gymnopus androsaceus JB14]